MINEWLSVIIANAVIVILAVIGASVRATLYIGKVEARILANLTNHAREDEEEFTRVRAESYNATHDVGETLAAIRQHINDVQLEAARLYVRREGFYESMKNLTETIRMMREELRADMLRMEQKIDAKP